MKKAFGEYRLLMKGNRRTGHLWQGPDHLLYIETAGFFAGFTESYRRIDYKNIQAISYGRSQTGDYLTGTLLIFFGLTSWGSLANLDSVPLTITFGLGAILFFVLLAIHVIRGPTCVCKIQTAVQMLHLKPVSRLRQAQRFAAMLGELCQAQQEGQTLSLETLTSSAATHVVDASEIKLPWTGLKLVKWALILLVASGALLISDVFIKNLLLFSADLVVGSLAYALIISALVKALRFELPAALKFSLWGAMINGVVSVITGYCLLVWADFEMKIVNPASSYGDLGLYRFLSNAGFEELGWVAWLLIALGAIAIFLGLLGLPSALRPAVAPTPSVPPIPTNPS